MSNFILSLSIDPLWHHPAKTYEIPLPFDKTLHPNDCHTTAVCYYYDKTKLTQNVDVDLRFVTGSADGYLAVWNVDTIQPISSYRYQSQDHNTEKRITALSVHYDSIEDKTLIVVGGGGMSSSYAFIWDVKEDRKIDLFTPILKIHRRSICSINIVETLHEHNITTLAVFASADRTVTVWNLDFQEFLFLLPAKHTDIVLTSSIISFSPEELYIVTGSWDKTVLFWKVNPFFPIIDSPVFQLKAHTKAVTCICTHRITESNLLYSGERVKNEAILIITGSLDNTVRIWDFEAKQLIKTLSGHKSQVTTVSVYTDKEHPHFPWIVSGSDDGIAIIWDMATGLMIRSIHCHANIFSCVPAAGMFGLTIAIGTSAGCNIYSLSKVQRVKSFHTPSVTWINIYNPNHYPNNPFGESIVLISCTDGAVYIFRLRDHQLLHRVKFHTSRINQLLIYSPPADLSHHPLVVSADGKGVIKIWDLFTMKVMSEHKSSHPAILTIGLHDPQEMKKRMRETEEIEINIVSTEEKKEESVDLSRPFIIAGGVDRQLTFWRIDQLFSSSDYSGVSSSVPIKEIPNAHTSFIRSIIVHYQMQECNSPLAWLITGSYDQTVKIRDLSTGSLLFKLERFHTNYIFFIALYDPYFHLGRNYTPHNHRVIPLEFLTYPCLITSSYDYTLGIWSLNPNITTPRTILHHLKGNTDAITALSIHIPTYKEENPLVISGSMDRMVLVWDLFTRQLLRKLVGHQDRISCISTFIFDDKQRNMKYPIILSGSVDHQTIVWEDALSPSNSTPSLPLKDDINRYFQSDCQQQDWPLITELIENQSLNNHDHSLFLENSHLFYIALLSNQLTFLYKFHRYLTLVLPRLKPYQGKTLLAWSIEKKNIYALRLILSSWTINLNQDITDLLQQRITHAMYFFPVEESLLAKDYPSEFELFINGLRLIRNHYSFLLTERQFLQQPIPTSSRTSISCSSPDLYDECNLTVFNNSDDEEEGDDDDDDEDDDDGTGNAMRDANVNYQKFRRFKQQLYQNEGEASNMTSDTTKESNHEHRNNNKSDYSQDKRRKMNKRRQSYLDNTTEGKYTSAFNYMNKRLQINKYHHHPAKYALSARSRFATSGCHDRMIPFDHLWDRLINPKDLKTSMIWKRLFVDFYDVIHDVHTVVENIINKEWIRSQAVTSLIIPLPNIHHHLTSFLLVSNGLNSIELLKSEVGIVLLQYYWDEYGRIPHFFATIRYLFFVGLFIVTIYLYDVYYDRSNISSISKGFMQFLNVLILLFLIYYLFEEFYQIYYTTTSLHVILEEEEEAELADKHNNSRYKRMISKSKRIKKHQMYALQVSFMKLRMHFINDFWNMIDAVIIITGIPGMALRLIYDDDTVAGRCFLSLCSISLWIKVLYFLRPYQLYGPLGKNNHLLSTTYSLTNLHSLCSNIDCSSDAISWCISVNIIYCFSWFYSSFLAFIKF